MTTGSRGYPGHVKDCAISHMPSVPIVAQAWTTIVLNRVEVERIADLQEAFLCQSIRSRCARPTVLLSEPFHIFRRGHLINAQIARYGCY